MAWNSPPVHPCPLHLINPYLTQTFCDGWKRPPVAVVTQVASGGVIQGQHYHHTPQWQYMFFWGFCTGEISKFSVIVRQGWCRLCDKPRRKKTQAALKYQMLISFFFLYRRIKNLKMHVRAMQSMFLKIFLEWLNGSQAEYGRACAHPAIVFIASFLSHLSAACPPVPSLSPTLANSKISSLDYHGFSKDCKPNVS